VSILEELKRRKVFKVGTAYLVVAWLLIQVAATIAPQLDLPIWVPRLVTFVLLLGFPIALVFAWVFDVTPDGIRVESSRKGSRVIFVAATALVALAIGWYFKGQPSYRAGDVPATTESSVAVLPFANMSGSAEQDFFSDGMTEELLNVLAKIPKLNVAARTSVFEFKGKGGDVREIGRKLGVTHIVEGSVRRDGEQVRVTAQLIRVADGFHVWSERYDRELKGVFALQDEIARQISTQLQLKLGVGDLPVARTNIDPVAYDHYLQGRALLRSRRDLPDAIRHFQEATRLAPGFAAAWSSMSLACEVMFSFQKMEGDEQAQRLACQADAAERAAALDAESATTAHALANLARTRFRYAEAERHYLRTLQIDPGYSDGLEDYAELLTQVGRNEDAAREARRLVMLDPYLIVGWNRVRDAAYALDRRAEVEEVTQQALARWPDRGLGKFALLEYAISYGRADEARAALATVQARWPDDAIMSRVLVPWALGDPGVDEAVVRDAIAERPSAAVLYFIARRDIPGYNDLTATLGAPAQCYYFARMNQSRPAGHEMMRDPRVKAKLVEYGFVDYWREKGWPAPCRAVGSDDFECGVPAQGP